MEGGKRGKGGKEERGKGGKGKREDQRTDICQLENQRNMLGNQANSEPNYLPKGGR